MRRKPVSVIPTCAAVFLLVAASCQISEAFNRLAHVGLFNKSVLHLKDVGMTEVHDFYTGMNSDSVDITVLADDQDEIMWVDIHSTTEPDQNAAEYLIDESYPYSWNDSLEVLEDPQDIEACKDCVRAIVDQFPAIALPRAGQETVYYPTRGAARSRYDFCWELPLSFIVGLVDSVCDSLGHRFGVLSQNSLRSKHQVHSANFKSIEYLNYAVRAWNDSACETSLRWLTRITNYDPHHTMTAFKSYDYLTEDWVSRDMDGDLDIDYEDAQIWNSELVSYGAYYQFFFGDMVDARLAAVEPGSVVVHSGDMLDHKSIKMTERANYSAALWPKVDELSDYFNGNALSAVDDLLPRAATSTTEFLASYFHSVINGTHPEYLVVCVEGVPQDREVQIQYELDLGDRALSGADRLRGEHFWCYEIPVSAGIRAESCVDCDTAMGYRFDRLVICDGDTTFESFEPTHSVDRASTVHVLYTPNWETTDRTHGHSEPSQGKQRSAAPGAGSTTTFLSQSIPNPVGGSARISYSIPLPTRVNLRLYSAAGELLMTLVQEDQIAGHHMVILDTRELATGVYFYSLEAGDCLRTGKLLVLR